MAKKSADERVAEAEKKAKEEAEASVAKAREDARIAVEKAESDAKKVIADAAAVAATAEIKKHEATLPPPPPVLVAAPTPSSVVDEEELKAMRDELKKNRLALKQAKSEARISQKEASRLKDRLEDARKDPQAFAERQSEGFKTPVGTPSKSSSFDSSVNDNELSASKSQQEFFTNLLNKSPSGTTTTTTTISAPKNESESLALIEARQERDEARKASEELSKKIADVSEEKDKVIAKLRKDVKELNDKKATETLTRAAEQEETKMFLNASLDKYKEDIKNLNEELHELRDAKTTVKKSQDEALEACLKLKKAEEEINEFKRRKDESETFRAEREEMLKEIETEKEKAAKHVETIQVLKNMDDEKDFNGDEQEANRRIERRVGKRTKGD